MVDRQFQFETVETVLEEAKLLSRQTRKRGGENGRKFGRKYGRKNGRKTARINSRTCDNLSYLKRELYI